MVLLSLLTLSPLCAETVNMKLAGADDRGNTINTGLINATIAGLSEKGGGTLYFPAGKYLTGAIKLKSNITIELESGATLLFSDHFDDYLPFVGNAVRRIVMKMSHRCFMLWKKRTSPLKGEVPSTDGKKMWNEFYRVIVDLRENENGISTNISHYGTRRMMWRSFTG